MTLNSLIDAYRDYQEGVRGSAPELGYQSMTFEQYMDLRNFVARGFYEVVGHGDCGDDCPELLEG